MSIGLFSTATLEAYWFEAFNNTLQGVICADFAIRSSRILSFGLLRGQPALDFSKIRTF